MKQLSLKQRHFVCEYIKTNGNATEAALRAYDVESRNVAGVIGYENLRKPNMRRVIDNILSDAGISEESISESLSKSVLLQFGNIESVKLALKLKGYRNI